MYFVIKGYFVIPLRCAESRKKSMEIPGCEGPVGFKLILVCFDYGTGCPY